MLYAIKTQVLVIGSGISGLFTALKLADQGINVTLLTKTNLAENNSRYAQGGIAAVLPHNLEDSVELHVADTLRAGAGLCDEAVVRSILAEGSEAVLDLLAYGVPFDRDANDGLALGQEAAHSVRRIIHAGGDATGHSVEMALIQRVHEHDNIQVLEYLRVIELLAHNGVCYGCRAVQSAKEGTPLSTWVITASHVVLATGGAGQLFAYTTNPAIATGDGLYLAEQAGAALRDLEFVQFHPTAFFVNGQAQFLISEALRGEGAILHNHEGEAFASRYHSHAELAPRDILTRALYAELKAEQQEYMWLDISHKPAEAIEHRFPTILQLCQAHGVDIRHQPIPVAPAAHYLMGGVEVDLHGQTSVQGLFAVGEVACSGLHGANRLASNSLLECVVLARRVAAQISRLNNEKSAAPQSPLNVRPFEGQAITPQQAEWLYQKTQSVKQLMWQHVGIMRQTVGLQTAKRLLEQALDETSDTFYWVDERGISGWNYHQQVTVSYWMTCVALARQQSVGAHFRQTDLAGVA